MQNRSKNKVIMKKDKILKVLGEPKNYKIIMVELPTTNYFKVSCNQIKKLLTHGYEGVYVSFQRPYINLKDTFTKTELNKLEFIDVATSISQHPTEINKKCTSISPRLNIDELTRAIYKSASKLKNKKRFIFIDSLTTITLHQRLSEVMRFYSFLMHEVKNNYAKDFILIFNVAKDLKSKRFIKDIALKVDKVIVL